MHLKQGAQILSKHVLFISGILHFSYFRQNLYLVNLCGCILFIYLCTVELSVCLFVCFTLFSLLTDVPISLLSPFTHLHPPFTPPPLPCSHHYTVVCVQGLCIMVLWLIPSSSFTQSLSLLSSISCGSVPCVHAYILILIIIMVINMCSQCIKQKVLKL